MEVVKTSHNLHFKITELARRFNPKTVLRQDTLLLYTPKECGERKKVCPFFLLENSRPLSPWGPLDSLSTCLGTDSLNTIQPSHLWMPSSPSALSLSQFQGFFNESFVQQSSHEKNTRASASASVLGVNIQG